MVLNYTATEGVRVELTRLLKEVRRISSAMQSANYLLGPPKYCGGSKVFMTEPLATMLYRLYIERLHIRAFRQS